MASMREIKRRKTSIQSTAQITKAMKEDKGTCGAVQAVF